MINTELKVKNLILKNRIVMPPMATSCADDKGLVTDALLDYYHLRAKGGYLGLVITEHVFVLPEGKAHRAQASMASDEVIEGQRKLVDIFHKEGIPVIAQISHAGMKAEVEVPYGPSETVFKDKKVLAMDEEHIQQIINGFVKAALRVKACGYDGVEIHSAHGYLLNQFYSPLVNKREDEYGTNRIKLHLEIIKKVREALGEDYLIALRLGALDYTEGGSTIEDALAAAKAFEAAGVDLLDISGGMNGFVIPG
ncbi:MAG: NADH:flavin oxidoreductase, partial [Erysipelotrichaceae bacterium]|nr:NADH:flavin oxidoreductase [Erysipelotrichaceae bacterium]